MGNNNCSIQIKTLHEKFYENADKYSEHIALIYKGKKITYKELSMYARRVSNYLLRRGVEKGDRVVVILPRGIEQIAALLGILAIGAVYVPISVGQPLLRRDKIVNNVHPTIILENNEFMDEKQWEGSVVKEENLPAYIIYTSGSSGEPKGVEMSHGAAMNTITEVLRMWNVGMMDSVLNISSYDFDLSIFDIFGILSVGGTIVLIEDEDYRDPEEWKRLIETYGITIWNSAPALLEMLLTLAKGSVFKELRLALVSGDWIPLSLPEMWRTVTKSDSQFVALGGATECGIWSNYYNVLEVDSSWKSIPYGQALPGQIYKIVDENLIECPKNTPGELLIGGKSLANGYLNDRELTLTKFILDKNGNRWYRTGDLGKYWEDGTIEFLGRIDTQVKIRGHRIELGEIESLLQKVPEIEKAIVILLGDKYHKELVAFYTGTEVQKEYLDGYINDHLPDYARPNSVIRIDSFPLNANGKVDRKKLEEYQKFEKTEITKSKSSNIVLLIWEDILGHEISDSNENLFRLGADSILTTRFVKRINDQYGITLHMKDVFENPTINKLSVYIGNLAKNKSLEIIEEGEI